MSTGFILEQFQEGLRNHPRECHHLTYIITLIGSLMAYSTTIWDPYWKQDRGISCHGMSITPCSTVQKKMSQIQRESTGVRMVPMIGLWNPYILPEALRKHQC
ncbi:hypothetical protein LSH36_271g02016 [Paralvinella palmiformis]|uniref:Uncharacterized protein n=1 Tax=Paralvinella palmiformis TaxID=53620 RepID=A0AAD9N437_9ANNE|nr:hypothetical protein LSH36_271g02016 [Paralvinella palmiformis]